MPGHFADLQPLEQKIARGLIDGRIIKEIAPELGKTYSFVWLYLHRMRKRLGYRTTEQMLCAFVAEDVLLVRKITTQPL